MILAAGRARRYGGCKPLAPVGPHGEAVIDVVASDALRAGFSSIAVVIGPSTGPAIRYHIEQRWPRAANVHFATQDAPLGTVHAVLAARDLIGDAPFGVGNADDIYGEAALRQLAQQLTSGDDANALVGFVLRDAVVGHEPVTRGICQVDDNGMLVSIDERRQVVAISDDRFEVHDGAMPDVLPPDARVSMNLWGFGPAMRQELDRAMARSTEAGEEAEVLLPEAVARYVKDNATEQLDRPGFRVLPATGRCIGVTHPDDLALVQAELAWQVGSGLRPAQLWSEVS